ncbi:MAG: hypothetical protein ACI4P8_03770 [Akkermansia sp.]
MKKTLLIAMLAMAANSMAATNLYYSGSANGDDLFATDENGVLKYLRLDKEVSLTAEQSASVLTSITTTGNTAYSLIMKDSDSVNFSLTSTVYLDSFTGASEGGVKKFTIDFGNSGGIITKSVLNFTTGVKGGNNITLSATIGLQDFSDTHTLERTLLSVTDNSYSTMYNYTDGNPSWTVTILPDLGKFKNAGAVTSIDELKAGEYGFITTANSVTLVAKTPEPTTATLSLLALAGLAARRRRH